MSLEHYLEFTFEGHDRFPSRIWPVAKEVVNCIISFTSLMQMLQVPNI